MKRILFLCTGNTCRSPMAQVIAQNLLEQSGVGDVECVSAGLGAVNGAPISENAQEALKQIGLDGSSFRSSRLTPPLLESADLVVAVTARHAAAVRALAPKKKILVLPREIPDPYGLGLDEYAAARDALAQGVEQLLREEGFLSKK